MKNAIFAGSVAVVLALAGAACTHHVESDGASASSSEQDLRAKKPAAFALQFVGSYTNAGAGELVNLQLLRTGKYAATFTNGYVEKGTYRASFATSGTMPTLPVSYTLSPSTNDPTWTAQITQNGTKYSLAASIDGETDTLANDDKVGPDETLCDDSGGSWGDDEADPTTGLFCTCPSPEVYIPSAGGCVR